MAGPIHYEVYIRRTAPSSWTLEIATEHRGHAIDTAEDLLRDGYAAAVRVTKETLDPDTMEFNSLTLMTKGVPEVQPIAMSGAGILKYYLPNDKSGWGKADFVEINPEDLKLP